MIRFNLAELIIVDNNSDKETIDYLKELEQRIEVKAIYNQVNNGFPIAVNQGIAVSVGNYVLIANNDIVVTKRPKSESAVATPRQDGWFASINPLQSRSQDSPTISDINKEPVPIENDSDDDVQSTG